MTASGRRLLADQRWVDIERPAVLVPVGSCEQHGPHLPVATDTIIASALAEAAAHRIDALVAPAVSITASGEHSGFAGTLSIGSDVLASVLVELIRSADWTSRLVLVNGHGGNLAAVRTAIATAHREGRRWATAWSPRSPRLPRTNHGVPDGLPDLHAGWVETSVMLHLRPDLVGDPATWPEAHHPDLDAVRRDGVMAHAPTGVIGNPAGSTADLGATIFADWLNDLAAHITDFG